MTPACRGIVQRMSDIALAMWNSAARAYAEDAESGVAIDEADDGIDVLHEQLTAEVAAGSMSPAVAAQVTLVSRFYERLGDHAVNFGAADRNPLDSLTPHRSDQGITHPG